ncbi:MAG: SDR family NAD(P)-dependent oxidoreductase, partial [Gammaproteobacteria bacterium]|nr:SDR family NAD(P)-dependent oxidoreductase [Gammaproteobacteria bacterium]
MKLDGTRVLLTGAAGGIGSAIAEQLMDKGVALAMLGRSSDELQPLKRRLAQQHPGAQLHAVGADLLDVEALRTAVDRTAAELGGIDLLINCAGMMSFRPFAEEDPAVLARLMQVNLVAPTLLIRAVLPDMLARGSGRIVNVGST